MFYDCCDSVDPHHESLDDAVQEFVEMHTVGDLPETVVVHIFNVDKLPVGDETVWVLEWLKKNNEYAYDEEMEAREEAESWKAEPSMPDQRALADQLRDTVALAEKAGMYDAADWIKERRAETKKGSS